MVYTDTCCRLKQAEIDALIKDRQRQAVDLWDIRVALEQAERWVKGQAKSSGRENTLDKVRIALVRLEALERARKNPDT